MTASQGAVTLTLTVHDKFPRIDPDERYGKIPSPPSTVNTLPMTVSEEARERKFKLPWGAQSGSPTTGNEQIKRLEKEKEAEDFIASLAGRSLSIQRALVEKVFIKERRKVKFGLSSNKIMDLAIRRYSYKYVLSYERVY